MVPAKSLSPGAIESPGFTERLAMASNCNLRIFRRNNKNTILLWDAKQLPDDSRSSVVAFIVDNDSDAPVIFSKFVPDNPDKFAVGVDGMVISHAANKIDPSKPCTIKVLFGEGDDSFEITKTVLPANSAPEAQERATAGPQVCHMYAMDYATKQWVPFPVNPELLGEV
jgi:hypothetical protein